MPTHIMQRTNTRSSTSINHQQLSLLEWKAWQTAYALDAARMKDDMNVLKTQHQSCTKTTKNRRPCRVESKDRNPGAIVWEAKRASRVSASTQKNAKPKKLSMTADDHNHFFEPSKQCLFCIMFPCICIVLHGFQTVFSSCYRIATCCYLERITDDSRRTNMYS